MKYVWICLAVVAISVSNAQGLLTNHDFEQDLSVGWTMDSSGAYIYIDRATDYDPDPNYEAKVHKDYAGTGFAVLYQTVNVPNTNLTLNFNAKVYAYDNDADTLCCAGAAFIIRYLNSAGAKLGETRFCDFTTPLAWASTSTCHLIQVADSNWHNYGLNINTEITTNLPGVNPAQVAKIEIALYDTTSHTC